MDSTDLTPRFVDWRQESFGNLRADFRDYLTRYEAEFDQVRTAIRLGTIPYTLWSKIDANAWIGGDEPAEDAEFLAEHRIGAIVNLAIELHDRPSDRSIACIKVGTDDNVLANCGIFEAAAESIDRAIREGLRVYIHCAAGISRSVTAYLTYLLIFQKIPWSEGLASVRAKRPVAHPHPLLIRSVMRDLGPDFIL